MQEIEGTELACAGEGESLAYKAQALWLESFGRSLGEDFGCDSMTLRVRTSCQY